MPKHIAIIENNIIATNSIRRRLTESIMRKGYRVTVLTTGLPEELAVARERGFAIIDVGSSAQNPAGILAYRASLRKNLKALKPDICLTFTIRPAIWGNMVTAKLGIPTLTNITGIGPLFASDNLVYRSARLLYKFVLKKTVKVFFQNKDDLGLFLKHGFVTKERTVLIPGSGIDYDFFAPQPLPASLSGFHFLFIGRLVKDKGILEYVAAAKILRDKYPEVHFNVLGPIWGQNLKSNTVTKSDIDNWVAGGFIQYLGETQDVRPYIAASHALVLPSYREGTSNVLLEAASMEKPAITCDTTGCREIVDDKITGFLCKVADAKDLARAMEDLLKCNEETRALMGKKARQKVIKEFDKKLVITAYLDAIQDTIGSP